jgi:carbamoyltransferase
MNSGRPWILGLSNNLHNGAACLIHGDKVVVAMQEERLTRIKRARLDYRHSFLCVDYCLAAGGIREADLDMVVECRTLWDPAYAYEGSALQERLGKTPFVEVSHHLGHAASCAGPAGFAEATVLVVDGGGSLAKELGPAERDAVLDWNEDAFEHLSVYHYRDGMLTPVEKHLSPMPYLRELRSGDMPDFGSLGHMFSAVAYVTFADYMEAGKVMGLAPYGRPVYPSADWFRYEKQRLMFSNKVAQRFKGHPGWPHRREELADLAASAQATLEDALGRVLEHIRDLGLPRRLAYAGGVALNSVANHRVVAPKVDELFVLPAAEDSGTALGAAYHGLSLLAPRTRPRRLVSDSLGRRASDAQIDAALKELPYVEELAGQDTLDATVALLADGAIVGWFEGGAEFGPRALGHRSILCDARRPDGKDVLNARVKHREAFRPFAPVTLEEHAREWFDIEATTQPMAFMLEVCPFKSHVKFPAVVHVDGSGRVQVLSRDVKSRLRELVLRFNKRTGVPMLVNTSFNVAGEPIVETPRDALWALLFTGIDYVNIEGRLFGKASGWAGPLTLIPIATARRGMRGDKTVFHCRTEHGEHTYKVDDRRALQLFDRIDGTSCVFDLARDVFGSDQEQLALKVFGWLMRIRAVSVVASARK